MPAPSGSAITDLITANLTIPLGPQGFVYLNKLTDAVSSGWQTWQDGVKFGKLTVSGAGTGAWSGTGAGGTITQTPFSLPIVSFEKDTVEQKKFTQSLGTVLSNQFTIWATSFKFSGLSYTGVSTATGISPGPFNANNVPTPMSVAGKGTNPSGISDDWALLLIPPLFNTASPQAKTLDFTDAIGAGIEIAFSTIWLTTSNASGNLVTGVGAPGGIGVGTSIPNGKIL